MVDINRLRGRAFAGAGGEERAYWAGLQLRAAIYSDASAAEKCRDHGIATKSAAESVNSTGGFLVGQELETEILSLRDLAGVFRKNARALTIGSDVRHWPRRTGGTTASFTLEGAAVTESTASFDRMTFVVKKIASLVRLSSEIYEDETAGLAQWLAEEIAWGFADKEDSAGFAGDGTSVYSGIRGLTFLAVDGNHDASKFTAATNHNTFATLDATDMAGFLGLLPAYAVSGAAIFVSYAGFANTLMRLAQNNAPLTSAVINGEVVWFYLGIRVELTPKLPAILSTLSGKAMMFYGNLQMAAAIATRRGVTIRTSEDRYLDTDQVGVIGTERVDINVHDMGDNSTAGPLVALVAP